ncbi:MAG: primosomal protein N' [Bacteroidota bacterium]
MEQIVEVILPLPIRSNYHYRIPEEWRGSIMPGQRVLVNFGRKKIYTGLTRKLISSDELTVPLERLKWIEGLLDEGPVFNENYLQLFDWIAFYYSCTPGEVFKAALPVGLKPESAMQVEMMPDLDWEALDLEDKEYQLLEALSIQPVLGFKEITDIWDIVNPMPRLKTMAARGLIMIYQQVEDRYKPKYKTYLKLTENFQEEGRLSDAFDSLSRAPAQENLLLKVVMAYQQGQMAPKTETIKALGISSSAVGALVKKGIIQEEDVQVDRLALSGYDAPPQEITLNAAQQQAVEEIDTIFSADKRKPVLLHGITGSGKTHIYVHLLKEAIAQGKQALYLLPEITLTKQIIDRVQQELGTSVGVYHSRFNDQERVEIWHKVRKREYDVVIGVRSAIFLPFQDLGVIVVDEEHDYSFKQQEPAPRYNARDVAVYMGHQMDIPVLLGSATPSFESFFNAQQGKYGLVQLLTRAIEAELPSIELVDLRMERKKGQVEGLFSKVLLKAMEEALGRKEQIILFQNRRGYAPYLICQTCGHVPQCINCDISLTLHKEKKHLRCHYCGYTELNTQKCGNCGHYTLKWAGIGTEKVVEAVETHFPNHTVERMDWDTTRNKFGYQQIINRFENRQIDILVGTQMVAKGLDFEHVTLVGVVQADHLLSFPDFRAFERAYQLLTQVSGRAGRSQKPGRVIIQTLMPDNVVLKSVQQPFEQFFQRELPDRHNLHYPPFTRMMRIEIRHKDRNFIEAESKRLDSIFRPIFGQYLLGPDYALVARLRNQYRMQFMVKLGKGLDPKEVRKALSEAIERYYESASDKTLRIVTDVDPF